jgi:hypothetical protein
VKIVPIVHKSTSDFQTLALDKRGCRLNAEKKDNSIFKYYTQKTCIFECSLRNIIPRIVSKAGYQFRHHIVENFCLSN